MKLGSLIVVFVVLMMLIAPMTVQAQVGSTSTKLFDVGADFSLYRVDFEDSLTWLVLAHNTDTTVSVKEQIFLGVQEVIPGYTFQLGVQTAMVFKVARALQPDSYCLIVTGPIPVFNCFVG